MTQKQIHRIAMVLKSHGKGHRGLLGEKSLKNSRGGQHCKKDWETLIWSIYYLIWEGNNYMIWSPRNINIPSWNFKPIFIINIQL